MINRRYGRKRKIRKIFAMVAFISIAAYLSIIYFNNHSYSGASFGEVIAKVNGQKIYKSEISGKISEIFLGNDAQMESPLQIDNLPAEVIEAFAKEIYFEKKLVSRAKKAKIHKREDVRSKIDQEQNRILIDAYLNKIITENVSEDKIKEKYVELSNNVEGKKEYSLSHIVVKDKDEAAKIYKAYNETKAPSKSAKFSELAKKYSIDKETADKKGDLGYVLEDDIIKEIAETVLKMKKGEYAKPIATKFGWHIVKINDIRDAKIAAFEEVKESIKEQMIKDQTNAIYSDIFNNIDVKLLVRPKSQNSGNKKEEGENDPEIKKQNEDIEEAKK